MVSSSAGAVPGAARTYEIDGIRGWAAFLIVLFHVYWEMLGIALPELRSRWVGILLNDRLAIVSFFVLSGDSLASAYFHRGAGRSLAWQLARRYLRLTVPVLLASGVVYLLLTLRLSWHRDAALILGIQHWLGSFLTFEPSIAGFLKYCLWDVYWTTSAERAYNPFLWTMQVEMLGSLFIYAICTLWPRLPRPALWLAGLTIVLAVVLPLMAAFTLGFLFSYARSQGWLEAARRHSGWQWLVLLALPAAMAISAFKPGVRTGLVVALMLLTCFHTHRVFHRFFDNGVSRWLGWVSFPLYLMQFPVLISWMSGWVVREAGSAGQPPTTGALMGIAASTVVVCVVAARAFVPVEAWCRRAAESALLEAPTRAWRAWRGRHTTPAAISPASRTE